jgi:hypothetical protein
MKNPFDNAAEVQATTERGRQTMKLFANATASEAQKDAQDSADRCSICAHNSTAAATGTNDPEKHLDAAKDHIRARNKHAGLASFHKSFGNKSQEAAAQKKAQDHQALAKQHAVAAEQML